MKRFVTIVAGNYLSYAVTLMSSVHRHLRDVETFIVVTDGSGHAPVPHSTVLYPSDLGLSEHEIRIQSFIYDVVEFATALKPGAIKHLLQGASSVTFLDPDTYVYQDLAPLLADCQDSEVTLTPHRLRPTPLDGLLPSEETFKRFGIFNLGFVSCSEHGVGFLEWWEERLRRYSTSRPSQMLFTDQRWVDLAPGYFNVRVLREEGANVAPWNLDERALAKAQSGFVVGDQPLYFMHFSSVGSNLRSAHGRLNPERSDNRTAKMPDRLAVFREMAETWWAEVEQHAQAFPLDAPYGWGSHANGRRISALERRLYRERVLHAEQHGHPLPPVPERGLFGAAAKALQRLDSLSTVEALEAGLRSDWLRLRNRLRSP